MSYGSRADTGNGLDEGGRDGAVPPGPVPAIENSTFETRLLVGLSVGVSFLVVVGAYWLTQMPIGPTARSSNPVVHVQIIRPSDPILVWQNAPPQPATPIANPQPEAAVDTPARVAPRSFNVEAAGPAPPVRANPAKVSALEPPQTSAVRADASSIAAQFQRTLLSHIERYRRYPPAGRRDRLQGVVQLLFVMQRDGTVRDVWVTTSSGHAILDNEAVATIRRAQPLPPIPPQLPDRLRIGIPVELSLR